MLITKEFTTKEEKVAIKEDMLAEGFTLVETQYHKDGNYLVFEKHAPIRNYGLEIDEIKAKIEELENK